MGGVSRVVCCVSVSTTALSVCRQLDARCRRVDELEGSLVSQRCESQTAQERAAQDAAELSSELDETRRERLRADETSALLRAEVGRGEGVRGRGVREGERGRKGQV